MEQVAGSRAADIVTARDRATGRSSAAATTGARDVAGRTWSSAGTGAADIARFSDAPEPCDIVALAPRPGLATLADGNDRAVAGPDSGETVISGLGVAGDPVA